MYMSRRVCKLKPIDKACRHFKVEALQISQFSDLQFKVYLHSQGEFGFTPFIMTGKVYLQLECV